MIANSSGAILDVATLDTYKPGIGAVRARLEALPPSATGDERDTYYKTFHKHAKSTSNYAASCRKCTANGLNQLCSTVDWISCSSY